MVISMVRTRCTSSLLRIKVIDLCPFPSLQETQPFFTRNLKPETSNRRGGSPSPELREITFIDQLLNHAIIEKLLRLGLLGFGIDFRRLIQGDLECLCFYQGNLFHEIETVLDTSVKHALVL